MLNKIKNTFNLGFIDQAAADNISFERAKNSVAIFYYLQVVLAFINLMKIGAVDPQRSGFLPIWPMTWAGNLPYSDLSKWIAVFYLVAALVSCFFWNKRFSRILVFLSFSQVHALDSSFGYMNHFYYFIFYACFFFIFLPDINIFVSASKENVKKFLFVYWGVIAALFATYTLSGIWKAYWGVLNLVDGQPGSFSYFTFSEHVAKKTIIESRDYFFSDFIISNPLLAWPAYLVTIYVEVFAIWAAFKPSLHKLWAFILVFMHVGILLAIGIPFFESIFVLCILLLNSPFTQNPSLKQMALDLPIFGQVLGTLAKKFQKNT